MIRLYDTKEHRKVDFIPLDEGVVRMYVCGPTVYNRIHIGNARTFISFDMIRRYFEWRGFRVTFVQNITDVDDKIIARAAEEGRSAAEVAAEYTQAFIDDMHAAGVADPTIRPKATGEIDAMIDLINTLIERGHAYEIEGDVYFSVRSDAAYGSLSGRDIDEMQAGHRTLRADDQGLERRKRDSLDFALWKAAKPGEPSWDSPWGAGRPGWHIECSAMSQKYLGLPFDIHGGGADLVFPHHENERAQSECACDGVGFARYWMHSGMLQINAEKMSKSLGNFLLLHEVLEQARPQALRMLMLQTHYRSPLDFSPERLEEADSALMRIEKALENMQWLCEHTDDATASPFDSTALNMVVEAARAGFIEAMDDDFNAPAALGCIFTLVNQVNATLSGVCLNASDAATVAQVRTCLLELMGVLGINLAKSAHDECAYPAETVAIAAALAHYSGTDAREALDVLIAARAEAKAAKDWACADAIRDALIGAGFTIEDTPQGAKVTFDG